MSRIMSADASHNAASSFNDAQTVMTCVLGVSLTFALVAGTPVKAGMIDGFTDAKDGGWYHELDTSPGASQTSRLHAQQYEQGLSQVLGGTRRTDMYSNHQRWWNGMIVNGDVEFVLLPQAYDGDGVLSMSTAGTGLGEFTLLYDAGGEGLDVDLTDNSFLAVDFDPDHLGWVTPSRIKLTLSDTDGNFTQSRQWTTVFNPVGRYSLQFDLAAFSHLNTPLGVDLSDIQAIQLNYLGDSGHDMSLYSIWTDGTITSNAVVPEPASLGLVILGSTALLCRRQRN